MKQKRCLSIGNVLYFLIVGDQINAFDRIKNMLCIHESTDSFLQRNGELMSLLFRGKRPGAFLNSCDWTIFNISEGSGFVISENREPYYSPTQGETNDPDQLYEALQTWMPCCVTQGFEVEFRHGINFLWYPNSSELSAPHLNDKLTQLIAENKVLDDYSLGARPVIAQNRYMAFTLNYAGCFNKIIELVHTRDALRGTGYERANLAMKCVMAFFKRMSPQEKSATSIVSFKETFEHLNEYLNKNSVEALVINPKLGETRPYSNQKILLEDMYIYLKGEIMAEPQMNRGYLLSDTREVYQGQIEKYPHENAELPWNPTTVLRASLALSQTIIDGSNLSGLEAHRQSIDGAISQLACQAFTMTYPISVDRPEIGFAKEQYSLLTRTSPIDALGRRIWGQFKAQNPNWKIIFIRLCTDWMFILKN